jgi:hypothetical protein
VFALSRSDALAGLFELSFSCMAQTLMQLEASEVRPEIWPFGAARSRLGAWHGNAKCVETSSLSA